MSINYKKKVAQSLASMIKKDVDLWKKSPNENAFNSNLYKRIGKQKEFLDMEYDRYVFKPTIALFSNPKYTGHGGIKDYHPKPDMIAHELLLPIGRDLSTLSCVVECKFNGDRSGILSDFYKLLAYRAVYDVDQLILVVYPKRGSVNPKYYGSYDVYNEKFLLEKLDELTQDEGVVFNLLPSDKMMNLAISPNAKYKDDGENVIIKNSDKIIKFNKNELESQNIVVVSEVIDDDEISSINNETLENSSSLIKSFSLNIVDSELSAEFKGFLAELGEENKNSFKKFKKICLKINDNYAQNLENDQPYKSLRNILAFAKFGDKRIVYIPYKMSGSMSGKFIKQDHCTYSDNDNTIWNEFIYLSTSDIDDDFIIEILKNRTVIKNQARLVYENVLKSKNAEWDEELKEVAKKKLYKLSN